MIDTIWTWLDGKKTYISAALLFVAGGLLALGAIDQKTFEVIATVAGSLAAFGIRTAIKKLE